MNSELESSMKAASCCEVSSADRGTTTPPARITPNITPTASMLFRLSKATLSPFFRPSRISVLAIALTKALKSVQFTLRSPQISAVRFPLNLVESISLHARFKWNRTALICGERRVNWTDFNALVNAIASILIREGLKKGDKVALLSLNSIDAVGVMYGVMRAGGVVVPLSALLTPQQLASFIDDSSSEFIFCDAQLQALVAPVLIQIRIPAQRRIAVGFSGEGWRELTEFVLGPNMKDPYPQLSDEDEANIMYSSGTTGAPIAIVHDHRARFL